MGLYINIEGGDGAGKSTVHRLVIATLRALELSVAFRAFPDKHSAESGILIRRYLDEKLPLIDGRDSIFRLPGTRDLSDDIKLDMAELIDAKLAQVLFSINRREVYFGSGGIIELVGRHDVLVTTRALSGLAYGTVGGAGSVLVESFEGDLPGPALTFLLDLDPIVARARRKERAGTEEIYDNDGFQTRVRAQYNKLVREDAEAAARESRAPAFVVLDALRSPLDLAREMVTLTLAHLGRTPIDVEAALASSLETTNEARADTAQ